VPGVVEAALGNAADQRHLAAFKSNANGTARTGSLALSATAGSAEGWGAGTCASGCGVEAQAASNPPTPLISASRNAWRRLSVSVMRTSIIAGVAFVRGRTCHPVATHPRHFRRPLQESKPKFEAAWSGKGGAGMKPHWRSRRSQSAAGYHHYSTRARR